MERKKQVKSLARGPGWLGGQVGRGGRLTGGPGWRGGQIGLYLILHLVNNSTLSTCGLGQVSTFKKLFFKIKEYFQLSNLFKMIRRIVQKIKNQKNGEIGEILLRPDGKPKKSSTRAFARTRAKNCISC